MARSNVKYGGWIARTVIDLHIYPVLSTLAALLGI
jgi:hypothetical protein